MSREEKGNSAIASITALIPLLPALPSSALLQSPPPTVPLEGILDVSQCAHGTMTQQDGGQSDHVVRDSRAGLCKRVHHQGGCEGEDDIATYDFIGEMFARRTIREQCAADCIMLKDNYGGRHHCQKQYAAVRSQLCPSASLREGSRDCAVNSITPKQLQSRGGGIAEDAIVSRKTSSRVIPYCAGSQGSTRERPRDHLKPIVLSFFSPSVLCLTESSFSSESCISPSRAESGRYDRGRDVSALAQSESCCGDVPGGS